MLSFPRETVEFLPITLTVIDADTGEPVEDPAYSVAVVEHGERPTTWTAAPYLITGLTPNTYDAYARVIDTPETPVTLIGSFTIT